MKKVLATTMILASSVATAQEITFPADFFTDKVQGGMCITDTRYGYDAKDIAVLNANKLMDHNNSLTVTHDELSYRWSNILSETYTAVAMNDQKTIDSVIDTLVHIANKEGLLSTKQAFGKCWLGGNKNSKCGYHTKQHTGFTFNAMVMSATVLKEHFSAEELAIVNPYFKKGYAKFIKPNALEPLKNKGLYEFADYGLGVLAYAHWTDDKELAEKELKRRHANWLKKISDDGLISQNSYRGHRGYWYHTLGANGVFSYALVAREFGWDFFTDPKLGPKLKALAESVYAGDQDIQVFLDLPFSAKNAARDVEDARHHMHQMALSLPAILKNEYGLEVGHNWDYQRKGRRETVDRISGFNSDCYYSSK